MRAYNRKVPKKYNNIKKIFEGFLITSIDFIEKSTFSFSFLRNFFLMCKTQMRKISKKF